VVIELVVGVSAELVARDFAQVFRERRRGE
jgi:hypothetical protein